jgi:hypothetical protein
MFSWWRFTAGSFFSCLAVVGYAQAGPLLKAPPRVPYERISPKVPKLTPENPLGPKKDEVSRRPLGPKEDEEEEVHHHGHVEPCDKKLWEPECYDR